MKKILLFVCAILCVNVLLSQVFYNNGVQYAINGNTVSVIGHDSNLPNALTIPSSVQYNGRTYKVTFIQGSAFYDCDNLTSVTIPSTITAIGTATDPYGAFEECDNLSSITIPKKVTRLGQWTFYSCDNLTSVTFEAYSNLDTINNSAFQNCSNLNSITIPNSVTSIGSKAFQNCSNLNSVTLTNNTEATIAENAFTNAGISPNYTSNGIKYSIGSASRTVGSYTFNDVGEVTFYLNGNSFPPPNEVTVTGATTNSITTANILSSVPINGNTYLVTFIGNSAFQNCSRLASVSIPNSVTAIGNSAFYGCSKLMNIYLPNNANIPSNAFGGNIGCVEIDDLYYGTINDTLNVGPYTFTNTGFARFHLGGNTYSATINNGIAVVYCKKSKSGTLNIPNTIEINSTTHNVTSVANSALSNCDSLTIVVIPNTATSIGDSAFINCNSLTNIIIPNSITSIGSYAFKNCSHLNLVILPTNATIAENAFTNAGLSTNQTSNNIIYSLGSAIRYIGNYKFANVGMVTFVYNATQYLPPNEAMVTGIASSSISTANIASSIQINGNSYLVTFIKGEAFYQSNLTSVTIPNSVTAIGTEIDHYGAFEECNNLSSITIPNSVKRLGQWTFYSCDNLTSVNFAENSNLDTIDASAFSACVSLNSIVIPNSVTYIADKAFYKCQNLSSVTIPNSVITIGTALEGYGAFEECDNLTSITIPSSVTSLGRYTFYSCNNLTSITCLAETAPTLIGNGTFSGTPNAKTLTIPFGSNYSTWQSNTTWAKTNHLIQYGERKELATDFTIDNTTSLINQGVLKIKQSGQLINQTSDNVSGIFEIESINRDNNWNYIGAPFNDYTLSSILPQTNNGNLEDATVSLFNHNTGIWNTDWASYEDEIKTGESFAAWNWGTSPIVFTTYGDIWNYETELLEEYIFGNPTDFTLFNENSITISHQDNNSSDGVNWLSVANPYTFKLDIEQIRTDNALQGDVLYTYNGTNFVPVTTGDIKVTEGFFVNNSTLTFNKEQRLTNSQKITPQRDFIHITMIDGEREIELLFAQNENAEQGYDRFDANKLFSPIEITEPYFKSGENNLVKEEVKNLPYLAQMNVKSKDTKDVTFKITNIPEDMIVTLIDGEQSTRLNEGEHYSTTITAGENEDRFKILFGNARTIQTTNTNDIAITNNNRQVNINTIEKDLLIEVYNTIGQKVLTTKDYKFQLNEISTGVYMIKAFNKQAYKTTKIVVE